MVGPQPDHGAAFAECSRGRCRAAAVIDVDLEIGTLNLPADALGIELEGSVRRKGQVDLTTKGGDIHVAQRSLGSQFDRSIFVVDMDVTRQVFQVDALARRVEPERADDGICMQAAQIHGELAVQTGQLEVSPASGEVHLLGDVRHSRFSWEGTGHRECAANVRDRDIPAAIDGYVSADIFRGHRATLDIQHGVALDLLHVDVAVFGGEVDVTGPLFHGDVAVAGRDRQIAAGRQLYIQIEMSAVEVAAAEVQNPYVALLFKL